MAKRFRIKTTFIRVRTAPKLFFFFVKYSWSGYKWFSCYTPEL